MSVFHIWSDMKYLEKTGHRVRTFFLGWGKRQKNVSALMDFNLSFLSLLQLFQLLICDW